MSVNSTFKIRGMHCDACSRLITKRVNGIEGVSVESITPEGELIVQSENPVLVDDVRGVLQGTSYTVEG